MMKKLTLSLIDFYSNYISILKLPSCRFYPTCSHYTKEAILEYGLLKGGYMGLRRILKCHPFNNGGYDPVLKRGEKRPNG